MNIKEFFEAEYNRLINYTRSYLDGKFFSSDPEDIVQDVALSVFSKGDINTPIENLLGYFYRSIRNRITDSYRKKNPLHSIEEGDRSQALNNPEDENEWEEIEARYALMYELLDMLKPDQKQIIVETELEGATFEEISERDGVPIGTLLSRKHRAMAKLNKMIIDNN